MNEPARIAVVGDSLLDRDLAGDVDRLAADAPVPVVDVTGQRTRPGGAALAAALAALDGRPVSLVTALGADDAGRELARLLEDLGVEVFDIGLDGPTPEKVRLFGAGQALVRLDHGGRPRSVGRLGGDAAAAVAGAAAVLASDYGRGLTRQADVRLALESLPRRTPLVWDPHPRGPEPVPGARLVTPNGREAGLPSGAPLKAVAQRARHLGRRWRCGGVTVTLGPRGAVLVEGEGVPLVVPVHPVPALPSVAAPADACGAGDRFASTAAGMLADGALVSEATNAAVASAAAQVFAGGPATFLGPSPPSRADGAQRGALDLVRDIRSGGGTVVATGGCFDLLHAGHVSVLRAARALGDCLVVCLNSDDSVRRIKGPGRPLQTADDRARVLSELSSVDAVAVFDEDTPSEVLERLRPDIFAKGADYGLDALPEAPLLAGWGGQAVVLPYLEGRSTTRLMKEATSVAR